MPAVSHTHTHTYTESWGVCVTCVNISSTNVVSSSSTQKHVITELSRHVDRSDRLCACV